MKFFSLEKNIHPFFNDISLDFKLIVLPDTEGKLN